MWPSHMAAKTDPKSALRRYYDKALREFSPFIDFLDRIDSRSLNSFWGDREYPLVASCASVLPSCRCADMCFSRCTIPTCPVWQLLGFSVSHGPYVRQGPRDIPITRGGSFSVEAMSRYGRERRGRGLAPACTIACGNPFHTSCANNGHKRRSANMNKWLTWC